MDFMHILGQKEANLNTIFSIFERRRGPPNVAGPEKTSPLSPSRRACRGVGGVTLENMTEVSKHHTMGHELRWLDMTERVQFRVATSVYRCLMAWLQNISMNRVFQSNRDSGHRVIN